MRSRLLPLLLAVAGLLLVGTGSVFAWLDRPRTTVATVSEEPSPSADGVDEARSNLQRAGLPLSVLDGGVGQLTEGSTQLDDGAHQLSDGLRQARDGGEQLADGLGQLDGGVDMLGDGARQVSGGVDEVVDRLSGFGEMQGDVTAQLAAVADTLGASADPVSQGAAGRLRGLVETLDTQGLGPDTLAQLGQLRDGARQLAYELTDPNAQFVAGMAQAADGSRQLRDGLVLLDDGGRALTDGTGQLVDGVGPVADVVGGIADNVRSATEALPRTAPAATDTQAAEVTATSDRQWWPFATIAVGTLLLVAATVVPLVAGRPLAVAPAQPTR
ncbi:hypothetical protein RCF27_17575 [Rhodococcus pyridinivorans]|uniref:X-X-X-Leu-X-X-Gly heptad repeat protein n=1 Tax=Rhodococcus pyridinivorans TaxID=103816 RepID=A0A7M2XJH7_9NOCA|nr:hypothetical protein [Rhodococcus pyridinivorans]QOV97817.1 hypothetical protein INP59_18125 [Rhodococcus pyridinivorans]WMM71667.1 hypothetical protein RCF27_17575 [Rhodococcus pyridinivorans]